MPDFDDHDSVTPQTPVRRRAVLGAGLGLAALGVLGVPRDALAVAAPRLAAAAPPPGSTLLSSRHFAVAIDNATGGVSQLANAQDRFDTNYVANRQVRPNFDVDDSRWVGDMVFHVRRASSAAGEPMVTSLSDDIRTVTAVPNGVRVSYRGQAGRQFGIRGFTLDQTYTLDGTDGDRLTWSIVLTNTSNEDLEFQDIGFPMLMNAWWNGGDQPAIYEQNVLRHSFVGGDGSYVYWQRPNGIGPFLVMTPQDGTRLEFKNKARYGEGPFAEQDPQWEGVVEFFVHAKNIAVARRNQAAAYLPTTSVTLRPGEQRRYGFEFRWAAGVADMHRVLFDAGVVDVVSLPGMVIPRGTAATLAVRARAGVTGVAGDPNSGVTVTGQGQRNGYGLYRIEFSRLGPSNVTVSYGAGRRSVLQYYATEPIENLVSARSSFLVNRQQARTSRGYDGAFLQWDMATRKLITWDDYPGGGWKEWMAGGSDDLGLAPAVFLSEKNVDRPVAAEVAALDYYLERFILGYLQNRRENGQPTYQVYRWYDGRDGTPFDQGVWRAYNYPHIANTYFNMHRIAVRNPSVRTRLSAREYLVLTYRTLEAMFAKIPQPTPIGDAANELGLMGEHTYPDILATLRGEGLSAEADRLQRLIEVKRDHMFAQAYPFGSEMSVDTTAFETSYTLAKMYGNTELAMKATRASLTARGAQPLWYFYGSDNRHMGESWWNLGYQTQLGAWQQLDHLLTYTAVTDPEFDEIIRSSYGAYVGGWANINSGQISTDPVNNGAAAWLFQSEKGTNNYGHIGITDGWWTWSGEVDLGFWGGLRAARTSVVVDRIVGLYAYAGTVALSNGVYTVEPRDGVRTRLTLFNLSKYSIELSGATYSRAQIRQDRLDTTLVVQRPGGGTFSPRITLRNLPAGTYTATVDGGPEAARVTTDGRPTTIRLTGLAAGDRRVQIRRV